MRRLWDGLGWMLATVFGVAGCSSTDLVHRPPKHPEEITVPPESETKFSLPPDYPKETLNQDQQPKATMPGSGGPGGPGMGGMGGMGGRGMGGMGGPGSPGGYSGRGY